MDLLPEFQLFIKTINKCCKEKEVASKNPGSHKKELQQRENNKKRLKLSEKEIIEQRATERERKRK